MKKLIERFTLYGITILITIAIVLLLFIKNNMAFDSLLPNIIIGLFQTVILGLIFHSISLVSQHQRKIKLNECIKVIISEPFVRFKDPKNNSIDLEKVNYLETFDYFSKNISKSSLKDYKEFLNIFYMQKMSIIGLINIASQIDHIHSWLINGLITTYTKTLDELELILRNNKFDNINDIDNVLIFKMGFNSLLELYSKNCLSYIKIKKI
jgi:hypothetical protein